MRGALGWPSRPTKTRRRCIGLRPAAVVHRLGRPWRAALPRRRLSRGSNSTLVCTMPPPSPAALRRPPFRLRAVARPYRVPVRGTSRVSGRAHTSGRLRAPNAWNRPRAWDHMDHRPHYLAHRLTDAGDIRAIVSRADDDAATTPATLRRPRTRHVAQSRRPPSGPDRPVSG